MSLLMTVLGCSLTCFLGACVSGTFKPVQVSQELPADLSEEMRKKFDFRDASLSSSTESNLGLNRSIASADGTDLASPHPLSNQKKKKEKKHHKKPTAPEPSTLTVASTSLTDATPSPSPKPFAYPNRRPPQEPIWQSERFTYSISYLGVGAGQLVLESLPLKTMGGRKVYHIRGHAISSSVFSLFYHLNDVIESFIDFEGFFSHRFHLVLDESKQKRDSLELNDSEKQQTYYWDRVTRGDQPMKETKKVSPIQPFSQDSISALYYLRTLPLEVGNTVSIPVVSEGDTWDAVCNVVRRETVGSPMGDIRAIVLKPEMKYKGILKKSGDSFLWLTDDDRRIPIRLEAKVRIGYVVANLNRVELGDSPSSSSSISLSR